MSISYNSSLKNYFNNSGSKLLLRKCPAAKYKSGPADALYKLRQKTRKSLASGMNAFQN